MKPNIHFRGLAAGLALVASGGAGAGYQPAPAEAVATLAGCADSAIKGTAKLVEQPSGQGIKTVRIELDIQGLPPGEHGVHIHETANCTPCGAAGGHFDPGPNGNSSPDGNHPYHLGDLVNLEALPDGTGKLETATTRVTLSAGPIGLFDQDGSALIIHEKPDTFCPNGEEKGCAGGGRIACGIIRKPN